jgi:hypothetical protein
MKFRITTLKRRPNTSDNGTIDIQIILNDDFYIQPTVCLTEIIYDNIIDSQNRYPLRYIRAQRSELFRVFARRLAYEMVNTEKFGFFLKYTRQKFLFKNRGS